MSVIQSLLELPDTLNNSLPDDELKLLDKTVTFFSQYQSFQLVNFVKKVLLGIKQLTMGKFSG